VTRLFGRGVVVAASMLIAIALEYSVLPFARLPRGGPDLVLIAVLAFAAVWGRAAGAVTGFLAGLTLDLAPPATGALGRHAIVLTLVGALAGHAAREMRRSALLSSVLAGLYALAAVLADALLGTLLRDGTGVTRPGLAAAALATAGYTMIATPLVVPLLMALARHLERPGVELLAPVGDAQDPRPPQGMRLRPGYRGPRPAPYGAGASLSADGLSAETPETV
jgi:rod shape-determining protein MreD